MIQVLLYAASLDHFLCLPCFVQAAGNSSALHPHKLILSAGMSRLSLPTDLSLAPHGGQIRTIPTHMDTLHPASTHLALAMLPAQVTQISLKAAFLNSGQNCAGGERFFVHSAVHDKFAGMVVGFVKQMRQGPTLGHGTMDAGAMCMPGTWNSNTSWLFLILCLIWHWAGLALKCSGQKLPLVFAVLQSSDELHTLSQLVHQSRKQLLGCLGHHLTCDGQQRWWGVRMRRTSKSAWCPENDPKASLPDFMMLSRQT